MSELNIFFILLIPLSFFLFKTFIKFAQKLNLFDNPEKFSNHSQPTPTASGIIFICLLLISYLFIIYLIYFSAHDIYLPNRHYLYIISILSLGILSFYDDIKSIHPIYRFVAHIIFVSASTPLLTENISFILPEKLTLIIIVFLWVFMINSFNFLDGSNGYLSVNSIFVFFGYLLVFLIDKNSLYNFNFIIITSLLIIMIIYLYFNFPKAKIFCGDSGSIVIGYTVGYVFFDLFFKGYWFIALALIIYPFLDVFLTIIIKTFNGKYPWERLFDYFFLKALKASNNDHKKIFKISLIYNFINFVFVALMIQTKIEEIFLLSFLCAAIKLYYFKKITKV